MRDSIASVRKKEARISAVDLEPFAIAAVCYSSVNICLNAG